MNTQKNEQLIAVIIYKKIPCCDIHNRLQVTLQEKENAAITTATEKKSAGEKEIAEQKEKN